MIDEKTKKDPLYIKQMIIELMTELAKEIYNGPLPENIEELREWTNRFIDDESYDVRDRYLYEQTKYNFGTPSYKDRAFDRYLTINREIAIKLLTNAWLDDLDEPSDLETYKKLILEDIDELERKLLLEEFKNSNRKKE